jgi:hypothetical protein
MNLLSPAQEPRLFNLEADPEEREDLAAAYPEPVVRMQEQWEAWFAAVTSEWYFSKQLVLSR